MNADEPRAITSRSPNRRSGCPSNDQVCSCATITGTRARRPIDGPPQIRAELVRVQHVHALPPQKPVERPPRPDLARRGALQSHDPHVGRLQVRERVRDVALARSPLRTAGSRHSVRSKRSGSSRVVVWIARRSAPPVPRRSTSVTTRSLPSVAVGGGHAPNIMPQPPAADACPGAAVATLSSEPHSRLRPDRLPQPTRAAATRTSSRARAASRCPPARQFGPEGVRGYYIDLRVKAEAPVWPHASLGRLEDRLWVRVHQWGLGAYERYLAGEGEQWLRNAVDVGRVRALAAGRRRRARRAVAQPPPLHEDLPARRPAGRPRWRRARARACSRASTSRPGTSATRRPRAGPCAAMSLPSEEGGVQATLDGSPWPEEYPTAPALVRAERRHLRAVGLLRRGRRPAATPRPRARSSRAPTCWPQPPPLGHRLLVPLRPLPAPRPERRQLLLPRAAHQPARGDERDRAAARVRRHGAAVRRATPGRA